MRSAPITLAPASLISEVGIAPLDVAAAEVRPKAPAQPLSGPCWRIWLDQWITRRKLFHVVLSPSEQVVYRSRLLSDCIAFLAAEEVDEYQLVTSHGRETHVLCRSIRL